MYKQKKKTIRTQITCIYIGEVFIIKIFISNICQHETLKH